MSRLLDHLERITNAPRVEDLWSCHLDEMAERGFTRLLYGYTRYLSSHNFGDPQDWVMLTNHSPEYMSRFLEGGFFHNAPMTRWALENDGACSWSWLQEMNATEGLTPAELRVMEFNRKMGVTAGYTLSFRSVSERTKGAMALTAAPGVSQAEVDAIWDEQGPELLVMNKVFHLKLLTLPWSGSRNLTKRQIEVLQWVGDGKTTQDIAVILGLTAATVEKHLRLAREALDVETTAQAVLKAAFYNQMFILESDAATIR
ncbi:LuxR family transcriptional regulator [Pseudoroseicyclus sp. H15]